MNKKVVSPFFDVLIGEFAGNYHRVRLVVAEIVFVASGSPCMTTWYGGITSY